MGRRKREREALAEAEAPKEKEPRKELEFSYAAEVEEIARELIPEIHSHLVNTQIEYVFRSQATKKNGKPVLGKARVIGGLDAYLAKAPDGAKFFVVEIAADFWKGLKPEQQKALVDHELAHCWVNEDTGKLQILPHDLEEFADIVRRHGLVGEDIRHFSKAIQMALPFAGPEPALD